MGVKITELIPKKEISWDLLKGKVIAVDTSNMIFQFLSSIRQADGTQLMDGKGRVTSHLVGIFSRIPNLMEKGIRPCFVFDGKAPALKRKERQRREDAKIRAEEKLKEAKDQEEMLKYSRMATRLDSGMIEEAKRLIEAMGLPVVQSPSEAEAQAALICRNKDAWAVATQDYDALLYSAPRVVQSLTLSQKKRLPSGGYSSVYPQLIELKEVLQELDLDKEQLLVLAILVGTDFNVGGVKGIGPKKALQLVQSGKKFKDIFGSLDADFDWEEVVDVFSKMPVDENYSIKFAEPDEERIRKLLVDEHDFSGDRVDNALEKIRGKPKGQSSLNMWMK
ncbi:MAG: flap endonuclease-1 [Candidatus Woesearchaeota archaeon]